MIIIIISYRQELSIVLNAFLFARFSAWRQECVSCEGAAVVPRSLHKLRNTKTRACSQEARTTGENQG